MKKPLLFLFLLLSCNSIVLSAQDSIFKKAVDTINAKFSEWAEGGSTVYMIAKTNGDISIFNRRNQSQSFNLFDLATNHDNGMNNKIGIEPVPCETKAHAPVARLNFYTPEKQVGFIRLKCNITVAELEFIRNEFLHLKSLCRKK